MYNIHYMLYIFLESKTVFKKHNERRTVKVPWFIDYFHLKHAGLTTKYIRMIH